VRRNDDHEAKFPLELAQRVVLLYTDKDDLVLDPFMGSGTTALAAVSTGRNFIGIEKEEKYVQLATKNVNSFLKQNSLDI
jgi:site-specific DNA-methyltransferase (adenine-specific)